MARSALSVSLALLVCASGLAADGCGSATHRARRATRVVAALGDSITAGSPAWDPNAGVPWNNGFRRAAPRIEALNRLIHAIARSERASLARFYAALDDPRRPGRMRARLTADGDHPSVAGYRVLGRLLAPLIDSGS